MSDKEQGLYQKYEVKKLSNPGKKIDCIVLEFDDENARPAIAAFADKVELEGYQSLADDLRAKLRAYGEDANSPIHELIQFFSFRHLPLDKQGFSKPFALLATWLNRVLPQNCEKDFALRKLLEAKDCSVRATIHKKPEA